MEFFEKGNSFFDRMDCSLFRYVIMSRSHQVVTIHTNMKCDPETYSSFFPGEQESLLEDDPSIEESLSCDKSIKLRSSSVSSRKASASNGLGPAATEAVESEFWTASIVCSSLVDLLPTKRDPMEEK